MTVGTRRDHHDAQRGDTGEAGLVVGGRPDRLDGPPQCRPGAPEVLGQAFYRGLLPSHLSDRAGGAMPAV